jgi:hypothetical protein
MLIPKRLEIGNWKLNVEKKGEIDGTQYYGYPKIAIASDYDSYEDPDIFFSGFPGIIFMKENDSKTNGYPENYFCEGKRPKTTSITSRTSHFRQARSLPQ